MTTIILIVLLSRLPISFVKLCCCRILTEKVEESSSVVDYMEKKTNAHKIFTGTMKAQYKFLEDIISKLEQPSFW